MNVYVCVCAYVHTVCENIGCVCCMKLCIITFADFSTPKKDLLDGVEVKIGNESKPLNAMAQITVKDPQTLLVSAFDVQVQYLD